MPSILIVDDLPAIHEMLEVVIKPTGYLCAFAQDGEEALKRFREEQFDVALVDIAMKPIDGITLLKEFKEHDPDIMVIMMTGYANLETAIQAVRYGAYDYIRKPFKINELIKIIERAAQEKARRSSFSQATPSAEIPIEQTYAGKSKAIQNLNQQIAKLAATSSAVLVQGESGVGKPKVVEMLYKHGKFNSGKLVGIDCTLADEATLKARLMGVDNMTSEAIQQAQDGVLFVKDINRMPISLQDSFAHLLQTSGAGENFRLIVSSSEELETCVDRGHFSEELLFRLSTLPLKIPPLRERKEDLPTLIKHIIATTPGSGNVEFSPEAMEVIRKYPWPGNDAELNNTLSNIIQSAEHSPIPADALPLRLKEPDQWPTLETHLAECKKNYIRKVMKAVEGDHTLAAKILGIPTDSLTTVSESSTD